MENRSTLAPKTIVVTILIAFAIVGVAVANGNIAPSVSIGVPAEGQHFKTPTPSFTYADSDTDGTIVERYCNVGGPVGGPTSTFSQPTCPTSGVPLSTVPEGAYYYNVMVVDNLGATAVASRTFRIDLTAPSVTIVSPAQGSVIVDETPHVQFGLDGASAGECSFDDGPFMPCTQDMQAPELSQGAHKLTVRATDIAGNVGTATVTFTIDLSAPLEDPLPPDSANVTPGKSKTSSNGRNLLVPVKAQILPSPDLSPKVACTGKVNVSIKPKVRRARTFKRRLKLRRRGSSCIASGKVTVPKRYKGKKATLRMRFPGNDYMSAISVTKTITL